MANIHDETQDQPGGNVTVNAPPQEKLSGPVQGVIDFTKGQAIGAAKGAASIVPESVAPTSWQEFAKSPGGTGAEGVGEGMGYEGARIAPSLLVSPFLKGASALTGIPRFSEAIGDTALRAFGPASKAYQWAVRGGKALERTGEGMLGGALEAGIQNENEKDPWKFTKALLTGSVEGGISSGAFNTGRAVLEALPPSVRSRIANGAMAITLTGGGFILWDTMGGHQYVPYHLLYHGAALAAAPLLGIAKGVSRLPPAVVGATYQSITHGGARNPADEDERVPVQ